MKLKILALISLTILLLPMAKANAQIPDFNPLCWKEKACADKRKALFPNGNVSSQGWINTEAPCTGAWGKCLPAGITETEIAFGGQRKFLNIGTFLQQIYKIALGVAGIVAVLMIMTAGAQWVTAGGNAEAITSAKKRIGGAMMGLFLAFASYFILNILNPALVNFRLPQTWMLRPLDTVPEFCSAAPPGTKFSYAVNSDNQTSVLVPPATLPNNYTYSGQPQDSAMNTDWKGKETGQPTFNCGNRFFVENGGSTACYGDVCPLKDNELQVCTNMKYNGQPATEKYWCKPGMLAGVIGGDAGGAGRVSNPNYFQDNVHLLVLCNDGKIEYVNSTKIDAEGVQPYVIKTPERSIEDFCGEDKSKIVGFYFGVEVPDRTGFGVVARAVGQSIAEKVPPLIGSADWYAVGQSAPNSHDCSVNLAKLARAAYPNAPAGCGEGNIECACGFLSDPGVAWNAGNDRVPGFKKHLISLEELKNGYQCNITINRNEFPATDNITRPNLPAYMLGSRNNPIDTGMAAARNLARGVTLICATAILTGVGALPGGICLASTFGTVFAVSVATEVTTHWFGLLDDPTSCRDKQ